MRKKTLIVSLFLLMVFQAKPQSKYQFQELDINDNKDYNTFTMLDSVVGKYNVFFTGENHLFRKSNYMLQLKMLKYLHQKAGVQHLFLEFGHSRG